MLDEHFNVQKNHIPFTALGCNHVYDRENKILKIEGGIKDIIRSDFARTEYTLAAPTLAEITCEIRSKVGLSDVSESKHHQLKQSKDSFNLSKIASLVEPIDLYGYSFEKSDGKRLYSVITRRVFPKCIYKDVLISFENFVR